MRNTLQEQYNSIKEGKGAKDVFLKHAKSLFPNLIPNHYEFNSASKILLQRGIISENMILNENLWGITTGNNKQPDWFKLFNENIVTELNYYDVAKSINKEYNPNIYKDELNDFLYDEASINAINSGSDILTTFKKFLGVIKESKEYNASSEEKETKADASKPSKEVDEYKEKSASKQYEAKTGDDVIFDQYLNGIQIETNKSENNSKTVDELKKIVLKNLKKDNLYYTKNAAFGIEGIGYTDEAPGLGKTKEVKGKYASSGMEPVKLKEGFNEDKIARYKKYTYTLDGKTVTPDDIDFYDNLLGAELDGKVYKMGIPDEKGNVELKSAKGKTGMYTESGIGMFNDPIGFKKPELSDIDKMFTKEYKGDGIYVIFKNGKEVKTINGVGNANAWINDQIRNMKLQESQLRSAIRQLIKEELNLKEIDQIGEEAAKGAKVKKISDEINKRKKKIKALETLKELEDDSINPKKLKELYSEIKKLEAAKNKLEKKGKKKETLVDEVTVIDKTTTSDEVADIAKQEKTTPAAVKQAISTAKISGKPVNVA